MRRALLELAGRIAWAAFWLAYWIWIAPLVLDAATRAARWLESRWPRAPISVRLAYGDAHRPGADQLVVALHLAVDHELRGRQTGDPLDVHRRAHAQRADLN